MDEHATSHRSFWRRHGIKLSGSNKNKSGGNSGSGSESSSIVTANNCSTRVVGAHYNYTNLVGSHSRTSKTSGTSGMLPSHYGSSPSSTKSKGSSSAGADANTPPPLKYHQRSTSSPHKSFDAFLKDTNDEWSDDLGYELRDRNKETHSPAPSHRKALSSPSSSYPQYFSPNLGVPVVAKPSAIDGGKVVAGIGDLLQDPTNIVYRTDPKNTLIPARTQKFKDILSEPNVDLGALKKLSWSGIPNELRSVVWQLLLGYLPCNMARRIDTLARKRKEYSDAVSSSYSRGTAGLDQKLWHQIHIDVPRTNPGAALYQYETTQLCLERILYQWAVRHPASGYVQGINDLVTPLFEVFLSSYIDVKPENFDMNQLDAGTLSVIEADSFWCLSKLLDGIQDNYTFAQPGIQRQIATLKELVSRIDGQLVKHLEKEGIEFIQFSFRWMNCLLLRELPMRSTVRMWDTYLAEGSSDGFSEFHVYVCAAFLVKWSKQLQKLDFQGIMVFLQQLPTQTWEEKDVELLLSEAYMWKTLFHNSPSHLKIRK
ncbi:rab-GTPase-TBC domain-containing protein [Dichotomocladium elegans]|nr:rab-GTPase-TBC domain-containing protein [Dichotomocladium elegans]